MADHGWVPAHVPEPEPKRAEPEWPEHIEISVHSYPNDAHLVTDPYFMDWWVSALGPTSSLLLLELNKAVAEQRTVVHILSVAARLGMQTRNPEDSVLRVSRQFRYCVERLEKFRFLYRPAPDSWSVALTCDWLPERFLSRLPGPLLIEHSKLTQSSSSGIVRSG